MSSMSPGLGAQFRLRVPFSLGILLARLNWDFTSGPPQHPGLLPEKFILKDWGVWCLNLRIRQGLTCRCRCSGFEGVMLFLVLLGFTSQVIYMTL